MEDVVSTIRAALVPDATDEARAAAAQVCRSLLAILEPPPPPTAMPQTEASPIAGIVAALRGAPAEQLLDLAIARLRAALPTGADAPAVAPLKFNIVPVPRKVHP